VREDKLHHGWNNNLFENAAVRIIGNGGEKRKISCKLNVAAFFI
jgi:hypothetical protein